MSKSKGRRIAIAFKSKQKRERATNIAIVIVGRAITIERETTQQNQTKNEAKKIKSIISR